MFFTATIYSSLQTAYEYHSVQVKGIAMGGNSFI